MDSHDDSHIDRLIARYLGNEATPEEQLTLFEWLERDDEHQRIFDQYCTAWKNASPDRGFDTRLASSRLIRRIDAYERGNKKTSLRTRMAMAAAVTLVVCFMSGLILVKISLNEKNVVLLERTNPPGQRSNLILADGSSVRLNSGSTIRFPERFKGNRREVFLHGEAYFEIERDSLRPFIIHTGDVETVVLGTSFNVQATADYIKVAVASGRVSVRRGDTRQVLEPFDKLTYNAASGNWTKEKTDLASELAWKSNTLLFRDSPLEDVLHALENWYGVSISADNRIGTCRITGTFSNERLHDVLSAIALSTDLSFEISDRQVILRGRGCKEPSRKDK